MKKEKTISIQHIFRGKLIQLDVVKVKTATEKIAFREMVRHPGAVAILAKTPANRFVFVRQYRKPAEMILMEIVAGTLKKGEKPELCARRELKEETGYSARSLKKMGTVFLAPGYSTEKLHVFFAETGNKGEQHQDSDENITVVEMSEDEVKNNIRKGMFKDAKTLAAWQMYVASFDVGIK